MGRARRAWRADFEWQARPDRHAPARDSARLENRLRVSAGIRDRRISHNVTGFQTQTRCPSNSAKKRR